MFPVSIIFYSLIWYFRETSYLIVINKRTFKLFNNYFIISRKTRFIDEKQSTNLVKKKIDLKVINHWQNKFT